MDISDEQFMRFLDMLMTMVGDLTPATQGFIRSLHMRHSASIENGGPGVTAKTLVSELVGILSYFETRLNALEEARSAE
ncbi:hypothetical protein [Rathayibacter toxicus]|uniref:Uncharacterized protein n=1 Tax=Rathayibacter toxicus TaxID=145458 RepID=A0A0U1PT34_9MICO|nr:hypothetical protein [Rathayibacter toxicus]ALS57354.1 hypothetical protein APU90_05870 [Rathayibacter toxicus]KKM45680.1 hypothetical protein VT73_05840 [Rathayibacter toxicus]PPG24770.1 hypothetical protein C5D15_00420 [Rathayibacter toxicus]PPG48224.1 hypothetical protein C5D16_00430 [Rathayibacter toxicus]PPH74371.1 hypothetical protein C5D24_00420 [Rathayibacter toxicus]